MRFATIRRVSRHFSQSPASVKHLVRPCDLTILRPALRRGFGLRRGKERTGEVSTMSDFDRNAATAQYGRPLTGAEAAVVDVGLRAYMLRIYNYMVIGLAITGFAALGVYLLSVAGDAGSAARSANGAAVALRNGVFLTPIGYALFVSPLKWLVILAPLGLVFFL